MSQALSAHDALAHRVLEGRHGTVVNMTGDGVHGAFDDALDALAATVDPGTATPRSGRDPWCAAVGALRTAHGGGRCRDNDYFGSPVNRAARIMGAAHGGQVLLS